MQPPETAAQILSDLARAFPRQPIEPATFAVYLRELDDVPPDALQLAVRELIRTSEFFPSVRAIRAAAVARALALPSPAAALAQVEERIAWARNGDRDLADAPPVHEVARWTLDRVGGYSALRDSAEPGIVRAQFLKLYREVRDDRLHSGQVGELDPAPAAHALGAA